MSTLYEIQTQYRALMAEMESILADPNPETLESDMAHLNELMGINAQEFQAKGDAYAAVIREKEARKVALKQGQAIPGAVLVDRQSLQIK